MNKEECKKDEYFNEKIGHCRKKIEFKNGKVFDEKTGQCEEKNLFFKFILL